MDRYTYPLVLAFTIAVTGCPDEGEGESDSNVDDSTGVDTTGGSTSTSTTSMSTSSASTSSTSTTSDATGDTGTTAEASTDTGSGGDVCASDRTDDECYACAKEMCCTELTACVDANRNCWCVVECILALENPTDQQQIDCASGCGVGHEAMGQLLTLMDCQMACEACGSAAGSSSGSSGSSTG